MKAIRVKNLRSLEDTRDVHIKPLTFLLGENSSGKSTFLRLLPLLKQSVEAKTKGPVLWYGRYVDFGSYDEAIGNYSKEGNISIEFIMPIWNDFRIFFGSSKSEKPSRIDVGIELVLAESKDNLATYTKGCNINVFNYEIKMTFDESQKVTSYSVNGSDYSKTASKLVIANQSIGTGTNIIPVLFDLSRMANRRITRNELYNNPFLFQLTNYLVPFAHHKASFETILRIINNVRVGFSDDILKSLKESQLSQKIWTERVANWSTDSATYKTFESLYLAWLAPQILYAADNYLYGFIRGIKYIAPLRASAERYYRFQDLDATEMDFQGRNLALVLQNMSISETEKFTLWTIENFGFSVEVKPSGGHSAVVVKQKGAEHPVSLADMGFGFSQVIPVIAQLWLTATKKLSPQIISQRNTPMTFAIEQPELHLHPRMQARLADVLFRTVKLAATNDINLNLIIETHSDTIINRIGLRIASGELDNNDVSIIIFDKPDSSEPTIIREVSYANDGLLYDWPVGFFEPEGI